MRRFIKTETKSSQPRVWEIWVKGNRVYTQQGQLGGEMTGTVEEHDGTHLGKKNEKSPNQVAEEKAKNKIKAKIRGNYYEVDPNTNEPLSEIPEWGMNFATPLEGTRLYKPQREPSAVLKKKMVSGDAFLTRKLDGMNHLVMIDVYGRPRMYTPNFLPSYEKETGKCVWLDRYPQIEAELERMELPSRTLLLGELHTCVHTAPKYCDQMFLAVDDFPYVGSVVKSLTGRAIKHQQENGWLGYCIYDIAYLDGEYLLDSMTHRERWKYLTSRLGCRKTFRYLGMPDIIHFLPDGSGFRVCSLDSSPHELEFDDPDNPIEDLLDFAKSNGWEGYVVRDPDDTCGDRGISFGGTHERPASVCKLKPKKEGDFIVRWDPNNGVGEWGRGRKAGGVGSAMAYVWDGEKEVEVGKVGGGLSDKEVFEFADPALYPMVWMVEFTCWTPKGKLREPRFKRVRTDKTPRECQEPIGS